MWCFVKVAFYLYTSVEIFFYAWHMRGVNEVFPWHNFAAFLSFLSWFGSCAITGTWQSLYLWYFSQVANISYPATRWFHGLLGNDISLFCVEPSWDSATLFCFILLKYEIIAEEVWQPAHCISKHTLLCYLAPHPPTSTPIKKKKNTVLGDDTLSVHMVFRQVWKHHLRWEQFGLCADHLAELSHHHSIHRYHKHRSTHVPTYTERKTVWWYCGCVGAIASFSFGLPCCLRLQRKWATNAAS